MRNRARVGLHVRDTVMFKYLGTSFKYSANEDSSEVRFSFSTNARERKSVLKSRKARKRFVDELKSEGFLESEGCRCSHCLSGWDCCGRMVPGRVELRTRHHGLVVVQHYSRNI